MFTSPDFLNLNDFEIACISFEDIITNLPNVVCGQSFEMKQKGEYWLTITSINGESLEMQVSIPDLKRAPAPKILIMLGGTPAGDMPIRYAKYFKQNGYIVIAPRHSGLKAEVANQERAKKFPNSKFLGNGSIQNGDGFYNNEPTSSIGFALKLAQLYNIPPLKINILAHSDGTLGAMVGLKNIYTKNSTNSKLGKVILIEPQGVTSLVDQHHIYGSKLDYSRPQTLLDFATEFSRVYNFEGQITPEQFIFEYAKSGLQAKEYISDLKETLEYESPDGVIQSYLPECVVLSNASSEIISPAGAFDTATFIKAKQILDSRSKIPSQAAKHSGSQHDFVGLGRYSDQTGEVYHGRLLRYLMERKNFQSNYPNNI